MKAIFVEDAERRRTTSEYYKTVHVTPGHTSDSSAVWDEFPVRFSQTEPAVHPPVHGAQNREIQAYKHHRAASSSGTAQQRDVVFFQHGWFIYIAVERVTYLILLTAH